MAARTPQITTLCYPRADATFLQAVTAAVDGIDGVEPSPALLAERLRADYPKVSVVPQEPLADLWHRAESVWYVYRDGGLLGTAPGSPID